MAITVEELMTARPQQWRDAADDALRSSKECEDGGLRWRSPPATSRPARTPKSAAIRLSAYHLQDLRDKDEYGAGTDKQLFTLYAADTQDVREKNENYGDDSTHRGGDIKTRGENWDRVEPHINDTLAWDALSDKERAQAIDQIESQTPAGHNGGLNPIYDTDGIGGGTGTGRPEPGTSSPSPNPPPTPPED
ncbi:hypothetical protein [Streptomyces nigra]|uniref:hypothetical protein n=1 Tax=Streptomyces nigra TaxID=1827580 RepID=UPI0035D7C3A5